MQKVTFQLLTLQIVTCFSSTPHVLQLVTVTITFSQNVTSSVPVTEKGNASYWLLLTKLLTVVGG